MIKQTLLTLTFLIALAISASAQGSSTAFRFRTGTPLPSTCRVGDVFYKNSATAGQYNCTATNTWTLVGASAGTVTTAGLTPGTLPVALTSTTLGDSLITQSGAHIVQIGGTVNAAIQVDYDNHKVFAYSDNIIDGPAFFATNELKSEAQLAGARGGTGVANSGKTITLGGNLTTAERFITSGAFATTLTVTGITGVTLPTTGTLATLAGSEALTNKTINGNTFTAGSYTLTGTAAKTLNFTNSLTLSGTDGSTLNIGAGGTLGSRAFDSTSYLPLAGGTMAGDLLFNGVSSGSATLPALSSFVGNTTQYLKTSQSAGLINFDALGSTANIGFTFASKGTGLPVFTTPASGNSPQIASFLAASTATGSSGQGPYFNFGVASSSNNSGVVQFSYIGAGSASNFMAFGIYGTPSVLNIFPASVKIGGTAVRGTTPSTNSLDLFNGTGPVGTLTNGATFYASSGEMFVMDAGGTATQLSSHDKDGYLVHNTYYSTTGKRVVIDAEKLLRFLNSYFGTDFVHEYLEVKQ